MTMTSARRADLLRVVEKLNLPIIEDNVYGFLDNEPPLAALAPETCIVIDSLSKKVAPGLTLGFIVPPQRLRESMTASVRSGGWTASGFAFAAAQRMMGDGTIAELTRLKRLDARARQKLAIDRLSSFEIQTNEKCYHLWLTLPALALADFRRGRSQTRHCVDTLDHIRRLARPCAERHETGVGGSDDGSARYRPAHIGRDAGRQGGGFRFDGMSVAEAMLVPYPTD
jgi:DNA-binding transcriptional MocR family regulator